VLEPEHPGRCLVEGEVLQFGRVGRVIGRDGVDHPTTQGVA